MNKQESTKKNTHNYNQHVSDEWWCSSGM